MDPSCRPLHCANVQQKRSQPKAFLKERAYLAAGKQAKEQVLYAWPESAAGPDRKGTCPQPWSGWTFGYILFGGRKMSVVLKGLTLATEKGDRKG